MAIPLQTPGPSGGEPPFGPEHTPYVALGGAAPLEQLVGAFYDRMDRDDAYATIRGFHPDDLGSSREKLFEFLSGWLGGPPLYIERYGHPRLRGRHMPFSIGVTERDQWLACMSATLDEFGIEGVLCAFLDARFAHVANFMRNQDQA